jgi:Rrf2 family protein
MAHLGSSVEYALHCLLWLVDPASGQPSSRDLAEMQGLSPSFLAKVFPKLEKAGIVAAASGLRGGYRLARTPARISVLDVVDAVEGEKPLFECQEIRGRCAVFGDRPPAWATSGVCGIHAVMLRAEQSMRRELASTSLADLATGFGRKMPPEFPAEVRVWFEGRVGKRIEAKASSASSSAHGGRARATGPPRRKR